MDVCVGQRLAFLLVSRSLFTRVHPGALLERYVLLQVDRVRSELFVKGCV